MHGCKPCFKTKNKAWKKQKKEEEESKCSGKVDDGNETLDLEWMKRAHSRIKTDRKGFERKKRMKNEKKRKIVFSLRRRSAKIWRASLISRYYITQNILICANSNNCNIHSSLCTDLQQLIGICLAQNLIINLKQPITIITHGKLIITQIDIIFHENMMLRIFLTYWNYKKLLTVTPKRIKMAKYLRNEFHWDKS